MSSRMHARILDLGEIGQGLVYLDHDDEGIITLRYRIWSDISEGPIELTASLPKGANERSIEIWEELQPEVLRNITPDRMLGALRQFGVPVAMLAMTEAAA